MDTPPSNNQAPATLQELQECITQRHEQLSKRLQQVARFVLEHPNTVALDTVAVIADQAGVHPSTLVRFASAFGYSGFSEMQSLFRQKLVEHTTSYGERVRLLKQSDSTSVVNSNTILQEFVQGNSLSMEHLPDMISARQLDEAVELLASAQAVHVVGLRRSFAVASYLVYALRHIDRRVHMIDGNGGMLEEQASVLGEGDVLVAISYSPYAAETSSVVHRAHERKVPIIAITDSKLSPLVPLAKVYFDIKEADVRGFRSLTSTLCLAQTLAISLAYKLEQQEGRSSGRFDTPAPT
ncbi:MurR/RpiR family transcriptional regulator [Pokkaliibacter sp. MBI-7]|uniref:MurR/RpiR family transcriptional regulator n=1 Tax=Pokkaliibacter sp. MBI-7 TaxID=3040600 RepID=UPI0024480A69|nr:MurR/RpiR family transcriptional regulator [Pokkaliibacter sp. MBI-7]MDH2434321.1 MurR/RpiR family transcriptional regulator [Pokkaliibacter sp. MBI-7]